MRRFIDVGILPEFVKLTRCADDEIVEASVVSLTRKLAQTEIDTKWWQIPDVPKTKRSQESDHSWRWAERLGQLRDRQWFSALAIQTDDGRIQGAILYRSDALSFVEAGVGAVNIEAVATAPQNRSWLVSAPVYRGVGSGLVFCAVLHSYHLGLGGRVNLVSVNDHRTIAFYNHLGFTQVGYDGEEGEERLPKFELDANAAQSWLQKEEYENEPQN